MPPLNRPATRQTFYAAATPRVAPSCHRAAHALHLILSSECLPAAVSTRHLMFHPSIMSRPVSRRRTDRPLILFRRRRRLFRCPMLPDADGSATPRRHAAACRRQQRRCSPRCPRQRRMPPLLMMPSSAWTAGRSAACRSSMESASARAGAAATPAPPAREEHRPS